MAERVRERLRETLYQKRLTNRDATTKATQLTGDPWTDHRVGRILAGKVELLWDDVIVLATVAGIPLIDLVRDPERELVADLSAGELTLVEAVRRHPPLLGPLLGLVRQIAPEPDPPAKKPTRAAIQRKIRAW